MITKLFGQQSPEMEAKISSHWQIGCHTRTGVHHDICQDALKIQFGDDGSIAAALADGVSGGARGDLAADTAVAYLTQAPYSETNSLQRWLAGADAAVAQALARIGPAPGACTAVAIWLDAQGEGWLTHMGDCRAYRYSPAHGFKALTEDHSYLNLGLLPPDGVGIRNPYYMLGLMNAPAWAVLPLVLEMDETLLLCSDGLHGGRPDEDIAYWLGLGLKQKIPLAALAGLIAQRAVETGSDDDIATILIQRG